MCELRLYKTLSKHLRYVFNSFSLDFISQNRTWASMSSTRSSSSRMVAQALLGYAFLVTRNVGALGYVTSSCVRRSLPTSSSRVMASSMLQDAFDTSLPTRRDAIAAAMAGLSAEAAWQLAVTSSAASAEPLTVGLPAETVATLESGRAVILPKWLPLEECAALREDVKSCYSAGYFKNFVLSTNAKADKLANDRWIMNSFSKSTGADGPFVNPSVGNFAARQTFKIRMAEVKAYLAQNLHGRPTLANDVGQSHEMEYLRYGQGARLQRHTDEHHVELQRPNGSRLPKKPNATRRSVTWMVYLNEDWNENDGGQLRLHERMVPSIAHVGSRGQDLQVGWLKATDVKGEQPVFLDPLRDGPENESCILYTYETDGSKRDLSSKAFANIALHLGGGDVMARKLMVDNLDDQRRFHLIDAPKSLVSTLAVPKEKPEGLDGGEKFKDIVPEAGTLVLFDSVSLPHQVLATNKERFGIQGWFHERLGYEA